MNRAGGGQVPLTRPLLIREALNGRFRDEASHNHLLSLLGYQKPVSKLRKFWGVPIIAIVVHPKGNLDI